MDHMHNIQNSLTGREFTIPLEEVDVFYDSLQDYLDSLGDKVEEKVPDSLGLAKTL